MNYIPKVLKNITTISHKYDVADSRVIFIMPVLQFLVLIFHQNLVVMTCTCLHQWNVHIKV